MVRITGQFLALFAVLASAINAQCALSCSLQNIPLPVPHHLSGTHAFAAEHACCPNQKSSGPNHQNHQPPACPDPLPAVSNVTFTVTSEDATVKPPSLGLATGYSFLVALPAQQLPSPAALNFSGFHHTPVFSILLI